MKIRDEKMGERKNLMRFNQKKRLKSGIVSTDRVSSRQKDDFSLASIIQESTVRTEISPEVQEVTPSQRTLIRFKKIRPLKAFLST